MSSIMMNGDENETMKDKKAMEIGAVSRAKAEGRGPLIWLAGDPEDLKDWMPLGIAGIVTNTVVLNQMVQKYGQIIQVVQRYLDITDKPVVVEIDGHSVPELLEVGRCFTELSDQIILKIPCGVNGLKAFAKLREEGVETFCTTVFSLTQAAALAQAGVNHILPFCEPVKEVGGDPTKLIRECSTMFEGWKQRPFIMAALVRSVDMAYAAFRDGADELVTMWTVYRDMMENPLTEHWNKIFMDEWLSMHKAGCLEGVPTRLGARE